MSHEQANRVWEKMAEAEVRSLYFGELAARYTRRKQIISGLSLFLSSGAAATLVAGWPDWLPALAAAIVAAITAYSIAANLDRAAVTMANLHATWNHLADDYKHLWHRWYEDDAEEDLARLLTRAREASEKGSTEAPYDQRLLDKWQEHVYSQYSPAAA